MSDEKSSGAASTNGAADMPATRPAIATTDNRYASPADILHAMLAEGWQWFALPAGTRHYSLTLPAAVELIIITRDGFEYVVNPATITWRVVLLAWQEYGFYIGKKYMSEFGLRDSLDVVQ